VLFPLTIEIAFSLLAEFPAKELLLIVVLFAPPSDSIACPALTNVLFCTLIVCVTVVSFWARIPAPRAALEQGGGPIWSWFLMATSVSIADESCTRTPTTIALQIGKLPVASRATPFIVTLTPLRTMICSAIALFGKKGELFKPVALAFSPPAGGTIIGYALLPLVIPFKVSDLSITTCSAYVPGQTWIVLPVGTP